MNEEAFYVKRMWSFSRALDLALIDEEIERGFQMVIGERHGERVAYIAASLGQKMGLAQEERIQLMVAGLLHDIGAVGGFRRYHGDHRLMVEHCLLGEKIIERFPSGKVLAPILRYHHEVPDTARGTLGASPEQVPLLAKIVALADKVDVHLAKRLSSRQERENLRQWVAEGSGKMFYPELVPPFLDLVSNEAFWLDLEQPDLLQICLGMLFKDWEFPVSGKLESGFTDYLAETFADLIDQKSVFTSRHSASVADNVERLARQLGWDRQAQHEIRVAGLLHDLGKLAIPKKILDKPGPLDPLEVEVIRTHTYYTHRLLTEAGFPGYIVCWAACHHERLDGKGYPFALDEEDLSVGARLMTISDIFSALTEDRPYRAALSAGEALNIIKRGVGSTVDGELVEVAERVLT
ncbi:MAG: HD-GYP domain-containing protein [Desulfitobacteriaceae bacterium]